MEMPSYVEFIRKQILSDFMSKAFHEWSNSKAKDKVPRYSGT